MAATVVIGRWGATHYGYLNDIPPMHYMLTCAAPLRDHAATRSLWPTSPCGQLVPPAIIPVDTPAWALRTSSHPSDGYSRSR